MTARRARTITPDDSFHRVHTYFKGSPYHPDGRRILYTRFSNLGSPATVALLDAYTGKELHIGESGCFTYHNGARAYFCSSGDKIIYQRDCSRDFPGRGGNKMVLYDLNTEKKKQFSGKICVYSGNLQGKFIQIDENYPLEEQGKMGIYIRNIDGTNKKRLAKIDDLLKKHPLGGSLRNSGMLFRLGGEISPDQKKVILFLVSRYSVLVRDYFICGCDGSNLEFHGKLGGHIMWHPDSRSILSWVKPYSSMVPDYRSAAERRKSGSYGQIYGFLGKYDTASMKMEIVSDYRIRGNCHVSPSPDGKMAVLDDFTGKELSIRLYNFRKGRMYTFWKEPRRLEFESRQKNRTREGRTNKFFKGNNPHPVFSRDSKKIIFNSCADEQVRLREIAI